MQNLLYLYKDAKTNMAESDDMNELQILLSIFTFQRLRIENRSKLAYFLSLIVFSVLLSVTLEIDAISKSELMVEFFIFMIFYLCFVLFLVHLILSAILATFNKQNKLKYGCLLSFCLCCYYYMLFSNVLASFVEDFDVFVYAVFGIIAFLYAWRNLEPERYVIGVRIVYCFVIFAWNFNFAMEYKLAKEMYRVL